MLFTELVEDLKSTTTRQEKEDFLNYYHNPFITFLLKETFDPNRLHNVRMMKLELPVNGVLTLEDMEEEIRNLFYIISNSHSSKENKIAVKSVMGQLYREDQEALLGVINKRLKMGVNIKTLNKIWPGFIDVKPIQLANKYSTKKKYENDIWFWSFKLDGVRIFAFRVDGQWRIYSRAKDYLGKELFTLDHWKEDLEDLYNKIGITYLEGEAYKHGWEFSAIQSLVFSTVNLKEKAKELMFYVFLVGDCNNKIQCDSNLSNVDIPRLDSFSPYSTLSSVRQAPCMNSELDILHFLDYSVSRGYEGIMLRNPNVYHSPKRDNNLLKVKSSYFKNTVDKWDCKILDVEFDDFTIQENGVITSEYFPVRLIVEQPDGVECAVGSGFTLDMRRWIADNVDEIIGDTVEVEHCGIGARGRMRFPVLSRIRKDV